MEKISYILIVFFFFLMSCQTKQNQLSETEKEEYRFPTIIDTSKFETSERKATWLSTANYELLYIGKWKDTIYPDYELKYYPIVPPPPPPPGSEFDPNDTIGFHKRMTEHKMYPYYIDWPTINSYLRWYNSQVGITVDTTQTVKNDDIHVDYNSPFFEAYPVLIENKEPDTIIIGHGHFLPIITEALDSLGKWKPIERKWRYFSGTGVGDIILPPNEIGLSATMIYHGSFPTTLRLRIADNYSNEFSGTINYRQFESMFNDRGDYKKEYKQEQKNKTHANSAYSQ